MYLNGYLRRSSFLVKLQAYSLRLDWEISSFGGAFKDFTKSFRKSFFYSFFIFYLFIYLFFQWVLPFVFLEYYIVVLNTAKLYIVILCLLMKEKNQIRKRLHWSINQYYEKDITFQETVDYVYQKAHCHLLF